MSIIPLLQEPAAISTGGYDNVNNWPSAANRPAVAGSTLSWIGPLVANGSAGGYHPSTTSDVAQSRVLTSHAFMTSAANGQVIEGLNISATGGNFPITVNHNNVTIRQCKLSFAAPGAYTIGVSITPGVTGTVIEDCIITGPGNPTGANAYLISADAPGDAVTGCTVARCNLSAAIKTMGQYLVNVIYIDNWCHDWAGQPDPDNDFIAVWFNSAHVTIQHNYFDQRQNAAEQDSCINCTTYNTTTSITDIYAINNACIGDSSFSMVHFMFWDPYQGNVNYPKNVKVVNSGFYGSTNATNGDVSGAINPGCTVLANSGNFIMSTPTSISGSLLHGTGALTVG